MIKKRNSLYSSKKNWLFILLVILLIVFAGFYLKGITGDAVLANYLNTAYATPLDVFNNNVSIFNISSSNLTAVEDIVNISVNVSINGYVYKKGYIFNQQTRRWEVFNFDQSPVENSYWIKNNASADLTIDASRALQNGENYIVAYACQKINNSWQCGCQTKDQKNCTRWMLHTFNVSSVITVPDTNCTSDANCSMTNGTCDILKGVCVSKLECIANCSCAESLAVGKTCSDGCGGICLGTKQDGTLSYPFSISTCEELQNISNNLTANYELIKDIDCIDTNNWDFNSITGVHEGFKPIGGADCVTFRFGGQCPEDPKVFAGNFNGNGFNISNLYIKINTGNFGLKNIGLFGSSEGNISNVGLINVNITGSSFVGGLVGYQSGGSINNSYSTGNVTVSRGSGAGGLVGYSNGVITNSYSTARINGSSNIGGLVGTLSGSISNSYSTGKVNGTTNVGGLVGFDGTGSISNSYATGNVDGSGNYVGGLVGINKDGPISNSYSTGNVSGSTNVGGFAGSFSSGDISNSYSIGFVHGDSATGGFVGAGFGSITNSFWDVGTSGIGSSGEDNLGALGKTTEEMNNISTFIDSGWSMFSESNSEGVWDLRHGSYPLLKWASSFPCGRYVPPICLNGYRLIDIPPVDSCGQSFSLICVAS